MPGKRRTARFPGSETLKTGGVSLEDGGWQKKPLKKDTTERAVTTTLTMKQQSDHCGRTQQTKYGMGDEF